MYIQKREREGHTKQNKGFFLISKDFVMNIDNFLISIIISVCISSINVYTSQKEVRKVAASLKLFEELELQHMHLRLT